MNLEIKHLTKEYRHKNQAFHAVEEVSFSVSQGQFVCIMGQSGCGKSTLLNMLTGLLRPTSGEILLDGEDICRKSDRQLADLRSTGIGYVLQGQSLLTNLTIWDNVCLPASLARKKQDVSERAGELLREVGLEDRGSDWPSSLSGGEARRAAIVRAMVNSPEILIADEPTCNLDPENGKKIMELFRSISRRGTTVLVSTHDQDFLEYADRVLRMDHGRLAEEK